MLPSLGPFTGEQARIVPAGLCQQLVRWLIHSDNFQRSCTEIGAALVSAAEEAHELRQTDRLGQLSNILLETPLVDQFRYLGLYYHAQFVFQKGDVDQSKTIMSSLVDWLPPTFKSKALLSLCVNYARSGNFETSKECALEAARASTHGLTANLRSFVASQQNLSVFRAMDGDNEGALTLLEQSLATARFIARWRPFIYLDHLNNMSVELMTLGRLVEAWNAISIVVKSPLARWYPHWHETAAEIAAKSQSASRSSVATHNRPHRQQPSEAVNSETLQDLRPFTESDSIRRTVPTIRYQGPSRSTLSNMLPSLGPFTGEQARIAHAGLYQQLVRWLIHSGNFGRFHRELATAVLAAAEDAHERREPERLRELSQVLLATPLYEEFANIGLYYKAQASLQMDKTEESRELMSSILDNLPPRFRSKALLSLGVSYGRLGDYKSSTKCALEAARAASCGVTANLRSFVGSQKNLAILRSMDGDNAGALRLLQESLSAAEFVGRWRPYIYLDHLNSLAVELAALGRVAEAQVAISISLVSPQANWNPSWYETAAEIAAKVRSTSRSIVATENASPAPPSEMVKAKTRQDWRPFTESEINGNGSVISLEERELRSSQPKHPLNLSRDPQAASQPAQAPEKPSCLAPTKRHQGRASEAEVADELRFRHVAAVQNGASGLRVTRHSEITAPHRNPHRQSQKLLARRDPPGSRPAQTTTHRKFLIGSKLTIRGVIALSHRIELNRPRGPPRPREKTVLQAPKWPVKRSFNVSSSLVRPFATRCSRARRSSAFRAQGLVCPVFFSTHSRNSNRNNRFNHLRPRWRNCGGGRSPPTLSTRIRIFVCLTEEL